MLFRSVHCSINVQDIDQQIDGLVRDNLAKHSDGSYVINLADLGFDKLLGKGRVSRKLQITAEIATPNAIEAVKAAGGEVIIAKAAAPKEKPAAATAKKAGTGTT